MHRRHFLREGTAAALTGASISWSSCVSWNDSGNSNPGQNSPESPRSDFLWIHGRLLEDPRIRDNLFAFAGRHDLSVILRVRMPGEDRTASDILREPLSAAREFGVTTWLAAGVLQHFTATEFVRDSEKRRTHRRRLSALVRTYDELSDGGRVILWEEAPIGGRWTPDGEWSDDAIRNLEEYGAEIFAAQRQTVKDVDSDLETGIFVHFTYIVDSKSPRTFANMMTELRNRDALPDFSFVDFYRGNYEKDIGPTETDRTVRSLITNAKDHTGDRDVYYLASPHTIKPNYTVSKQSIRMDLRAALAAAVDGVGWYVTSKYRRTEQGFDAFVPNTAPEDAITGDEFGSFTVARDRFLYAYASTLRTEPDYHPGAKFDVWLRGTDLGFHDHRVSIRTVDGDWTFLGDIAGYRDGEYPYSTADRDHVAIFHALDRDDLVDADGLELRFETDSGADISELTAAWLLPFDPGAYLAEHEATDIVGERQVSDFAFGEWSGPEDLEPGEQTRISIPAPRDSSTSSLVSLANPGNENVVRHLRERESDEQFDHASAFDLWILGSNLEQEGRPTIDLQVTTDGGTQSVDRNSVTAGAIDGGIVFYGLSRDTFLDPIADESVEIRHESSSASVRAVYAMPYFGSENLKPPSEAVRLVEADPQGAGVFSDASFRYDRN